MYVLAVCYSTLNRYSIRTFLKVRMLLIVQFLISSKTEEKIETPHIYVPIHAYSSLHQHPQSGTSAGPTSMHLYHPKAIAHIILLGFLWTSYSQNFLDINLRKTLVITVLHFFHSFLFPLTLVFLFVLDLCSCPRVLGYYVLFVSLLIISLFCVLFQLFPLRYPQAQLC